MPKKFYYELKSHLANKLPRSLLDYLPRSYKRIGHIAFLNIHPELMEYLSLIGETTLGLLQKSRIKTVAVFDETITGVFRTPSIKIIAGESVTQTEHHELGCTFVLDTKNIMFSAGNHGERTRLISWIKNLIKNGKLKIPVHILDMFACVGNLSLPIAVNVENVHIKAIELNPQALSYLKNSLNKNKLPTSNKFEIIGGDNREKSPEKWADIILMGYFGVDESHIKAALSALKPDGGWILIHDTARINKPYPALQSLKTVIKTYNYELNNFKVKKVKSISPNTEHVVIECKIVKS